MIPLGQGEIPSSAEELQNRVQTALGQMISDGSRPAVTCAMSTPGNVEAISIDLTGTEVTDSKVSKPTGFTSLGATTLGQFALSGQPARIYGTPVNVKLQSRNMPMQWMIDDRANLWFTINHQQKESAVGFGGNLDISLETADLEKAVTAVVAELAQKNGAKLKSLQLRVTATDNSQINIQASVAASKFMMTARLQAVAHAVLAPNLDLTVRDIQLTGEDSAGAMVASMLAGKVGEFKGKTIPLGQYVFAGASIRNITIQGGDTLRVTGEFGSSEIGSR